MTIHPRLYDMLKPLFYHIMEVIKVAKTHIILEVFVYLYVPQVFVSMLCYIEVLKCSM
jgi:hypothetical protein